MKLGFTLREEHKLRVFENRVLREIFGPKRDEVTGEWKILHNEKPYDLHPSPNVIRAIKSIRIRLPGHVACVEEREVHTVFWWGHLRARDHLEALG